jgi:hypothetical protein
MRKILVAVLFLLALSHPAFASPLDDFSPGKVAVDLNRSVTHLRNGGADALDFSVANSLGGKWAIKYRQVNYAASYYNENYTVKSGEVAIIYKVNKTIQLYSGYSRTRGYDQTAGAEIPDKNAVIIGTIVTRQMADRTKVYTIIGGGRNETNIEFGLSYEVKPGVEITSSYRHLTVEKVGPGIKENFRGFSLGVTFKF